MTINNPTCFRITGCQQHCAIDNYFCSQLDASHSYPTAKLDKGNRLLQFFYLNSVNQLIARLCKLILRVPWKWFLWMVGTWLLFFFGLMVRPNFLRNYWRAGGQFLQDFWYEPRGCNHWRVASPTTQIVLMPRMPLGAWCHRSGCPLYNWFYVSLSVCKSDH